ncbi:MAG: DUF6701 domain-containing protein [Telluria sp.]
MSGHWSLRRWLAGLIAAMLVLVLVPARADTPVTLLESFAGHVNFTGTEATLRTSGSSTCAISPNALTKTLNSIPAGSTINKIYLYWAGSGGTPDFSVSFTPPGQSTSSTVKATRQYTGSYLQAGTPYYYFAGVADVTNLVTGVNGSTGNGTYSFSGLSIDATPTYCNVQGVLGGFALLVIYTNNNEPYRVLNLYEGFRFTHGDSFTLSLSNFRVPSPIGANSGRIAHITWEGDSSLSGGGEQLKFNSTVMTDGTNPPDNQFNSASNIDNDKATWGIDFDAYTVGSGTINGGDTSATTTYGSGQDLVWLNAEIVAVPNVPVGDLKVAVTRAGTPALNGTVTYTATVSSNGPDDEPNPITFTNQLPDGMSYVSVTPGAGWTCASPSGQAVTCNYAAGLGAGAALPAITIKGKVTTMYSSFVEAASVVGTLFDNVPDNNNASDVWTNVTGVGYMFTDKRCVPGTVIGSAASNCLPYNGPYNAGSTRPLFITYHNAGTATAYHKKDATVSMRFSLTCYDPLPSPSTVAATFAASSALPLCTSGVPAKGTISAWTPSVAIYFDAGEASGKLADGPPSFVYGDVGRVQLNLYDVTNNLTAFSSFVSIPSLVHFSLVENADHGSSDNANGFAQAGETFFPYLRVETATGSYPPSFGKETDKYAVSLGVPDTGVPLSYSVESTTSGTVKLDAVYKDLGSVDLTATITSTNPNAAPGTYFGLPVTTETRTIGLFYPAYFTTAVSGGTDCLAHMACPSGSISKFIYSGQPFGVSVSAWSTTGSDLTAHLTRLPAFPALLSVVSAPGNTGSPIAGSFGLAANPASSSITLGGATPTGMPVQVALGLPVQWNSAMPHPSPRWTAPTSAYLRVSAPYKRRNSATTTTDVSVSSNRGASPASVEGGIQVVDGRLLVDNANGSELIKLPLYLHAQYWNGYGWENNGSDTSPVANSAVFTSCKVNLIGTGTAPNNCGGTLSLQSGGAIALVKGAGSLWVAAPGAGRNGSATVTVPGAPAWLPSTAAQAVFGTYRSKFVYIREVY